MHMCTPLMFWIAHVHGLLLVIIKAHRVLFVRWHVAVTDLEVIKIVSCSAGHEIFSAYYYENAKNSWHFHIY